MEETATEVAPKGQELPDDKNDEILQLASALLTVRLDYVATIQTGTGSLKKSSLKLKMRERPLTSYYLEITWHNMTYLRMKYPATGAISLHHHHLFIWL